MEYGQFVFRTQVLRASLGEQRNKENKEKTYIITRQELGAIIAVLKVRKFWLKFSSRNLWTTLFIRGKYNVFHESI